jgi:uncharacterized membrane protein YhaH (DUF805 family)
MDYWGPAMTPLGEYPAGKYPAGKYPAGEYPAGGDLPPPRSYLQGGEAGFGEAIKGGLRNWLVYRGRASRSAYWWFILFTVIAWVPLDVIFFVIPAGGGTAAGVRIAVDLVVAVLFIIAVVYLGLAELALLVRRLHDTGRSGWWVLIGLIPLAGAIVLLVFTLSEGTRGPNRYDTASATR